jgi:hypothetical protein
LSERDNKRITILLPSGKIAVLIPNEEFIGALKLPADAMKNVAFSNYSVDVSNDQVKVWSDIMKGQKLIDADIVPASVILSRFNKEGHPMH